MINGRNVIPETTPHHTTTNHETKTNLSSFHEFMYAFIFLYQQSYKTFPSCFVFISSHLSSTSQILIRSWAESWFSWGREALIRKEVKKVISFYFSLADSDSQKNIGGFMNEGVKVVGLSGEKWWKIRGRRQVFDGVIHSEFDEIHEIVCWWMEHCKSNEIWCDVRHVILYVLIMNSI